MDKCAQGSFSQGVEQCRKDPRLCNVAFEDFNHCRSCQLLAVRDGCCMFCDEAVEHDIEQCAHTQCQEAQALRSDRQVSSSQDSSHAVPQEQGRVDPEARSRGLPGSYILDSRADQELLGRGADGDGSQGTRFRDEPRAPDWCHEASLEEEVGTDLIHGRTQHPGERESQHCPVDRYHREEHLRPVRTNGHREDGLWRTQRAHISAGVGISPILYVRWAVRTFQEEDTCCWRLNRFARWAMEQQADAKTKKAIKDKAKPWKMALKSSASSDASFQVIGSAPSEAEQSHENPDLVKQWANLEIERKKLSQKLEEVEPKEKALQDQEASQHLTHKNRREM